MNSASLILALWATRNEVVGWGPPVADAFRGLGDHLGDALVLGIAAILVLWANGGRIFRLLGFREKTGPRWSNDEAMGNEILDWMRRRVTVTDTTTESRAKAKGKHEIAFAFSLDRADKRPVTVMKLGKVDAIQFTARVTPNPGHADTIRGMDEPEYRAMQDDLSLELVKSGIPVVVVQRIIPERGQAVDEDGDEIPSGVFMADLLPVTSLTESDFISAVTDIRKGILVAQVVIRKHVRIEDAKRGRSTPPIDISAGLSVVASASASASVADDAEATPR